MNENAKLVLVFVLGVVIGVFGATSTLFQGEPEQAASQIVASPIGDEASGETEQGPAETVEIENPVEQSAAESAASESASEPPETQAEASTVQAELPQSSVDETEQGVDESFEAAVPAEQDSAARLSCMLMENSGQCRCYDVETAARVNLSAEECREQLAEE